MTKRVFRLLFLLALVFVFPAQTIAEGQGNLLENEDLAVLCSAMYEYQLDLEGFDANLLETKRHLMTQHMLNMPNNAHNGDKSYFREKVSSVKASLATLPEEQRLEIEYEGWTKSGNPCDQISALTFILNTAEAARKGDAMTPDEARIILKKIYPWEDRYSGILDQGLEVQLEKAKQAQQD
jgi:hypothetical protein